MNARPAPCKPHPDARHLARPSVLVAFVFVGVLVPSAHAQSSVEAENQNAIELAPFDVTATKTSGYLATNAASGTRIALQIESTPLSISVLTKDFLADRGNLNITDAASAVPNIRRNVNNSASFTIRGFESGPARQDGFPNASGGRYRAEMAEIERLEVIKGPTSVLFGFGNPGGVINLVSKRPQPTAARNVTLEYGSYDRKKAVLDLTGPLVKRGDWQLLYRVVGAVTDTGGFRDFENSDSTFVSTQLQLNYRNTTSLRTGFRYAYEHEHAEAFILMPFEPTAGILLWPPRSYNTAGPDTYAKYRQLTEFVEFTHSFSKSLAMRAAYTYDDQYYDALRLVGAQMRPTDLEHIISTGNLNDEKRHVDSFQFDLTGTWKTPLGKLKTVVGTSRIATDNRLATFQNNRLPGRIFPIFDLAARDYSVGNLADYTPVASATSLDDNLDKLYYALGTLETWEGRLTLMAAVGHGKSTTSTIAPITSPVPTLGEFSITKPQFGVSLRLREGVFLFANSSESGAINSRFPDNPEEGKSREGGVKMNFKKFSGSVTYFDTKRSNIQVQTFNGLTGQTTFALSGQEEASGIEFEGQFFPTDQFQLVGSYSYTESKIVSDDALPARVGTPLPNAPQNSMRLWAKYNFKGGRLDRFWVGAGVTYTDTMIGNRNPNLYRIWIPSMTRWDAAIGYSMKLRGEATIDWVLNVENVTDLDYIAYQFVRGTPRSARLAATVRF